MPTNFTVVPVDDVEDNAGAESDGSKPVSLGKLFGDQEDVGSLQRSPSGRTNLQDKKIMVDMTDEVHYWDYVVGVVIPACI